MNLRYNCIKVFSYLIMLGVYFMFQSLIYQLGYGFPVMQYKILSSNDTDSSRPNEPYKDKNGTLPLNNSGIASVNNHSKIFTILTWTNSSRPNEPDKGKNGTLTVNNSGIASVNNHSKIFTILTWTNSSRSSEPYNDKNGTLTLNNSGIASVNNHSKIFTILSWTNSSRSSEPYNDKNGTLPLNNSGIASVNNHSKIFTILAWTTAYYGGRDWGLAGSKPFKTCQYKNCFGTIDRERYQSSDAVLFHMKFFPQEFPNSRPVNQKWVMYMNESPYQQKDDEKFNNMFNVTWTYHRKSDIWTNYSHTSRGGLFVKKEVPIQELVTKNYAAGKTKLAAWFVTHCATPSRRENYVNNLRKHVNVDVYGACGSLTCNPKPNNAQCMHMLERNYKFHLSFENAVCEDYVTEKLWNAIHLNIVPVVMGGFNYSELLPPKSYIDVKDYASPKELADYLQILNNNDTLYNEYLQWKGRYDIVQHPSKACTICEYLNKAGDVKKSYDRLDLFWSKQKDCSSPEKFYINTEVSSWH